jgi:hypothetical protein
MSNYEKIEKLCSGFSLLDEKDQDHILGVLQALFFAKQMIDSAILLVGNPFQNEGEKRS